MITAHTDVVGSLLRPVALRKARDDWMAGRLSHAQFKSIEDRAVDEAVCLQEAAGLDIVTDGEMRRLSFQSQMTEAVDGFGPWDINAFLWGHWHGDGAMGERRRDRPVNLGVVSRLVRKRHLAAEEFVYLRGRTSRVAKVTLPSPSLLELQAHSGGRDATLRGQCHRPVIGKRRAHLARRDAAAQSHRLIVLRGRGAGFGTRHGRHPVSDASRESLPVPAIIAQSAVRA
jgi:methionine synthase II (cobalamin-independent)